MIQKLVDYINNTLALGTIGAYVSLGFLALVALLAFIGLLFGLTRGFSKSAIRLITIGASAVGAFMLAGSLSGWLFGFIESKTPEQLVSSFYPGYESLSEDVRGMISSIDVASLEIIIALVLCIVLVPLAFILFFLLFKAISMLVYWLLSGLMAITSFGKSPISTLCGGIVGMVQGAFIALVIIFPLAELSLVAGEVRDDLTAESVSDGVADKIEAFYEDNLDPVINNPLVKYMHKYGGGGLYNSLTTTKIQGVTYSMTEQAESMAKLVAHCSSLKGFNYKSPTAEDKAILDAIITDIDNCPYLAELVTGVMRTLGTIVDNGHYDIKVADLLNDVVHTTVIVFKTSTPETLHNDLVTIKDVYYIIADNDLFNVFSSGDTELIARELSKSNPGEKSVVNQIIAILDANPHTRPVVSTLTKISLSVMSQNSGMSTEEIEELYTNVHSGVSNILSIEFAYDPEQYETEEEYKEVYTEQISTELEQTLTNNGITGVDEETLNEMATIIADKNIERQAAGDTEITDQDVNDAILSYYEAYAQKHGLSGDISQDFPEGIPGTGTEGGEGSEE